MPRLSEIHVATAMQNMGDLSGMSVGFDQHMFFHSRKGRRHAPPPHLATPAHHPAPSPCLAIPPRHPTPPTIPATPPHHPASHLRLVTQPRRPTSHHASPPRLASPRPATPPRRATAPPCRLAATAAATALPRLASRRPDSTKARVCNCH